MAFTPINQIALGVGSDALSDQCSEWDTQTECEQNYEDHDHENCRPSEWWPDRSWVSATVIRGLIDAGWTITPPESERIVTMSIPERFANRHPSTKHVLAYFDAGHLPDDLRAVSEACGDLAYEMTDRIPDGPELTTGLRKLLEAKDCMVRAAKDARA